jgi:hypothetical protein
VHSRRDAFKHTARAADDFGAQTRRLTVFTERDPFLLLDRAPEGIGRRLLRRCETLVEEGVMHGRWRVALGVKAVGGGVVLPRDLVVDSGPAGQRRLVRGRRRAEMD